MPAASLPGDEAARLLALRRCRIMDTPPEAAFDALTQQAREICGASMAAISLVDDRRQWFKSRVGFSRTEEPREQSLCAHALLSPRQPLVVPDAAADPRFADSPLVTGDSRLRFYAGAPLLSPEGQPLGTLCVFDQVPRELSPEQITQLGALARQTSHQLALRRRAPAERRLAQGFALTLALLIAILGLCFWQAQRFLASDWWVDYTKDVTKDINETLAAVQAAESSQRGFSATGQEDFLVSFQQALDGVPGRLNALRTLVKNDPAQAERCRQLAALIERRTAVMREYIQARQQLGLAALDAFRINGKGRRAMADLMAEGREMIDAENAFYDQRNAARTHDLRVATGMLLGTGALCIALLTAGFVLSRRELRRRQALGGSLAQANAGLSAEVAERRQAQASLRESEARFRRIANNVPGMVYRFVIRADGSEALPFVSEGCRKIYGLEPEQIQRDASLLRDCVHPDDREEHARSIVESAATLTPWSWQGRIRRPDNGQVRWVQGASQPERQPDGSIVWDGVLVDATERRQADDDRRAKEEAERSNREKSQFLSRVSHELRTPLNAILGFGQLLQASTLRGQDAEALHYILKSGKHLLGLVDEVLDLSGAESGELRLAATRVDAAELVRECLQLVAHLAQARRVTCHFDGFAQPTVTLWCDGRRLRQILLNLLSNAVKYNREGGDVWVRGQVLEGKRLRLEVTDTGDGISPEDLARLFVPFARLQTGAEAVEGVGLGLVVSRRVAEAMGGRLELESTVGAGSTCRLELPLGEEADTEPPAPELDVDALKSLLEANP
ncbi:MAG: CHASE3 domain-containing protein [Gluconacetobacter diazotrophicus]|nr:CHASE3 domain-containing protein [Gluconacetobacter diazotrophicus]